jgi:hypothetical protein
VTKSITATVRAGVAIQDMRGFTFGTPPAPEDAVQASPPRPLWKRLVVRSLRSVKRVLTPALFRVQSRMASAVDSSYAASVLLRLDMDLRTRLGQFESDTTDRLCILRDDLHDGRTEIELIRMKLEDSVTMAGLGLIEVRSLSERMDRLEDRGVIPLKGAVAVRGPAGYVLAAEDDDRAIVDLVECGARLAPTLHAVIGRLLQAGGGVIDVGAGDGRLAMAAARRVGPAGRVRVVCAAADQAALIARAARLNGSGWVEAEAADPAKVVLDKAAAAGARIDLVRIGSAASAAAVVRGMRRIMSDNPGLAILAPTAEGEEAAWLEPLLAEGFKAWTLDPEEPRLHRAGDPARLGEGGELLLSRDLPGDGRLNPS